MGIFDFPTFSGWRFWLYVVLPQVAAVGLAIYFTKEIVKPWDYFVPLWKAGAKILLTGIGVTVALGFLIWVSAPGYNPFQKDVGLAPWLYLSLGLCFLTSLVTGTVRLLQGRN